jgi:hypothetical protein
MSGYSDKNNLVLNANNSPGQGRDTYNPYKHWLVLCELSTALIIQWTHKPIGLCMRCPNAFSAQISDNWGGQVLFKESKKWWGLENVLSEDATEIELGFLPLWRVLLFVGEVGQSVSNLRDSAVWGMFCDSSQHVELELQTTCV